MTWLMNVVAQQSGDVSGSSCSSCSINWPVLAVLLQVLTLAYLAYAFRRTTKNQTRIEEYLKRLTEKDEK